MVDIVTVLGKFGLLCSPHCTSYYSKRGKAANANGACSTKLGMMFCKKEISQSELQQLFSIPQRLSYFRNAHCNQ